VKAEDMDRFNDVLRRELVGLQLQVLAFAWPVDFTFGPEQYLPGARKPVFVRFESPFELRVGETRELIDPGTYGANVTAVFDLLWKFVSTARIDASELLHLTFSGGWSLDVLPDDHVEWEFHDTTGGLWNVCGGSA
jgi:hypothetical protein